MTSGENVNISVPSASEYILDNFEQTDRIAILVLNRNVGETIQRITSAQKASSPEFQAWLRYKNANGSDIYIGMNPLRQDASTRTKEDIESIRHVYLDLDRGGPEALKSLGHSSLVPKPNYVLTSSPGKFQISWKVEEMRLDEAEELLNVMAREFRGDPAATDATRVLRLPGFANKKYGTDFYVEARQRIRGNLLSSRLPNWISIPRIRRATTTTARSRRPRHEQLSANPNTTGLSRNAHWPVAKRRRKSSVRSRATETLTNTIQSITPGAQSPKPSRKPQRTQE